MGSSMPGASAGMNPYQMMALQGMSQGSGQQQQQNPIIQMQKAFTPQQQMSDFKGSSYADIIKRVMSGDFSFISGQ